MVTPEHPIFAGKNTIVFQLKDWHQNSDVYDIRHFTLVGKDGTWDVAERNYQSGSIKYKPKKAAAGSWIPAV